MIENVTAMFKPNTEMAVEYAQQLAERTLGLARTQLDVTENVYGAVSREYRELLALDGPSEILQTWPKVLESTTRTSTEGMAVQLASCCRPIPGDPILGFINKGKGLIIHTHDCPTIAHYRNDPDKWVDVEWDPETRKMFEVSIKLVVANQRGVLAKVAATIADADSNIDNVSMAEEDGSAYTTMYFTLQVENRMHLARVMRGLRQLQEVVRINRTKG